MSLPIMSQVKQSRADEIDVELEGVVTHPPPPSKLSAAGAGDINLDIDAVPEAATGRRCRLKPVFIIGITALVITMGVAVGMGSSRNKRAAVTSNTDMSGTAFEKSFMMTNANAGPKSSASTSRDSSLLCGCEECEVVADESACGVINENCHTCGSRIDWLQTSAGGSFTEKNACRLVGKDEFPQACGPCYKCKTRNSAPVDTVFWCNNPTCTDALFNADNAACDEHGCHSCKSRVEYLENVMSFNEKEACSKVTKEFPDECPCKWNTRNTRKSM